MGDKTHIEIGTETRNRLRAWKSHANLTYDEAIEALFQAERREGELVNGYLRVEGLYGDDVVYRKTRSGDRVTTVRIGPIPDYEDSDRQFVHVREIDDMVELGEFKSFEAAVDAAREWMQDNPEGI